DIDDLVDGAFTVDHRSHRSPFARRDFLPGVVPPGPAFRVPFLARLNDVRPDALGCRIVEDDVAAAIDDRDTDGNGVQHELEELIAPSGCFVESPRSRTLSRFGHAHRPGWPSSVRRFA